jgi:hypothetical protein
MSVFRETKNESSDYSVMNVRNTSEHTDDDRPATDQRAPPVLVNHKRVRRPLKGKRAGHTGQHRVPKLGLVAPAIGTGSSEPGDGAQRVLDVFAFVV